MIKRKLDNQLPENCQLEVVEISDFGDLLAVPVDKNLQNKNQKIYVSENSKIKPALAVGDVFVGRLSFRKGVCFAKPIVRVELADPQIEKMYGVVEKREGRFFLVTSEKSKHLDYLLDRPGKVKDGDFVSFYLTGNRKFKEISIIKNFGTFDVAKSATILVLEKYNIPLEFSEQAEKETTKLPKFDEKKRENLTNLPFVTIDGDDSKDFDDAIWAEKVGNGFRLAVAIADVAFYVRPEMELDREAYKRGNSVYLPNMVIPMLPEILSNDLCSLRPKEKRAAIVCLIEIDQDGRQVHSEFKRAVIKSAARLTYKEVQEAIEGKRSDNIAPVYKSTIQPVYEAYKILEKARKKRGSLELETTELKIKFDKNGKVSGVEKAILYESNKLIEEFMIAANVAAALLLGQSKLPVMYRVHDRPQPEKLQDMKPLLEKLNMKLPDAPALKPEHFNKVIEKCQKENLAAGISELVLRMQSQAQYTPDNIGHFGLGLSDYVHFTSPIRRYADLLIHRAIIRACKLPEGGELEERATVKFFEETGAHLVETERKAVSAEREMTARFLSEYLKPSIGQEYDAKISGLSTAGVFVRLESLGAEGLLPMRRLPSDRYDLDDSRCSLVGKNSKLAFNFGAPIKVQLEEASPVTGGLIFSYTGEVPEYEAERKPAYKKDQKKGATRAERKKKIKKQNRKKEKECKKSS